MMNAINTSDVLAQLRTMAAQASLSDTGSKTNSVQSGEFSALLKQSVGNVNKRQVYSEHLAKAFELGDPSVDLSQVMIEGQKARIAFETLSQVRNKFIAAYQEIMNMPI